MDTTTDKVRAFILEHWKLLLGGAAAVAGIGGIVYLQRRTSMFSLFGFEGLVEDLRDQMAKIESQLKEAIKAKHRDAAFTNLTGYLKKGMELDRVKRTLGAFDKACGSEVHIVKENGEWIVKTSQRPECVGKVEAPAPPPCESPKECRVRKQVTVRGGDRIPVGGAKAEHPKGSGHFYIVKNTPNGIHLMHEFGGDMETLEFHTSLSAACKTAKKHMGVKKWDAECPGPAFFGIA